MKDLSFYVLTKLEIKKIKIIIMQKLEKIVGDSDKYCMNFIFPKEKSKKKFRIIPIMKDIIFRFI